MQNVQSKALPSYPIQKRELKNRIRGPLQAKRSKKHLILAMILSLGLGYLIGWFIPFETQFSAQAPGGNALETAFWMTALGASFLSYFTMDFLFRGKDTKAIATLPIHPLAFFDLKVSQLLRLALASTIPIAGFWAPYLQIEPLRASLNILLWLIGLIACLSVTIATVINVSAHAKSSQMTNFGPASYVIAPALSLSISLFAILILKLWVEALLKPHYMHAALTASGLILGLTITSYFLARFTFKRHYYMVLAQFRENDLMMLNENYDFIGDRAAQDIGESQILDALLIKDHLQLKRRYGLSQMAILFFTILFSLLGLYNQNFTENLFIPAFTLLPLLVVSRPWSKLTSKQLEPGIIDTLPIAKNLMHKAKTRAMFRASISTILPLVTILCLPIWIHQGLIHMALQWALALVASILMAISLITLQMRTSVTAPINIISALIFALIAFIPMPSVLAYIFTSSISLLTLLATLVFSRQSMMHTKKRT